MESPEDTYLDNPWSSWMIVAWKEDARMQVQGHQYPGSTHNKQWVGCCQDLTIKLLGDQKVLCKLDYTGPPPKRMKRPGNSETFVHFFKILIVKASTVVLGTISR